MVWGPLLPSPVIRTRDVVAIQSRQRVRCRCRSRWHYAICAIFLNIVTSSFSPSLWSKILNVTSLKKVLLNDLEIAVSNYLLSFSKRLQLPSNRFLPLWNQLKSALGPAGNRSSPPWALTFVCNSGSTHLLKCSFQIQGVYTSKKFIIQLENSR